MRAARRGTKGVSTDRPGAAGARGGGQRAARGRTDAVAPRASELDVLVGAGAAIDRKTNSGETALIAAAQAGHADIVEALLAAGADANDAPSDGSTALRLASERRHVRTVQVLLAAGAAD